MNKVDLKKLAGYERDFALWSAEQAALLRAGKLDRVDIENVAEEIDSLGKSDKHEISSRMVVLLQHLLKWQFQPEKRTNSWLASILGQRQAINDLIDDSPSLAAHPGRVREKAYKTARLAASGDTHLALSTFPETCPYAVEQVLDLEFLPE